VETLTNACSSSIMKYSLQMFRKHQQRKYADLHIFVKKAAKIFHNFLNLFESQNPANYCSFQILFTKAPEVFRSFKQIPSIDLYQNLCCFVFPWKTFQSQGAFSNLALSSSLRTESTCVACPGQHRCHLLLADRVSFPKTLLDATRRRPVLLSFPVASLLSLLSLPVHACKRRFGRHLAPSFPAAPSPADEPRSSASPSSIFLAKESKPPRP
jgi:hypothetical protein